MTVFTVCTFQSRFISIARLAYLLIFSLRFLEMLTSFGTAMSMMYIFLSTFSSTKMSRLLWLTRLPVCTGKFQNLAESFSRSGSGSYSCTSWGFLPSSILVTEEQMNVFAYVISWRSMYFVGARVGHPEMTCYFYYYCYFIIINLFCVSLTNFPKIFNSFFTECPKK